MVEHGCAILAVGSGRHRELEAQTAIKRGYLNVLHAREAIARHAAELAAGRPASQRRWLSGRSSLRSTIGSLDTVSSGTIGPHH